LAAAQPDLPPLRALRAQFNKFVYLDEKAEVILTQQGPTSAALNISVDGASRSKVSLDFSGVIEDNPRWSISSLKPTSFSTMPLNLTFEQMSERSGRLSFKMMQNNALALFPSATKWLGPRRIAAVTASSCLVGMVCPGLHSIYGKLSIKICADTDPEDFLAFRVIGTDSLFRSVDQEIAGGGITGTVRSFARKPPVKQATMESLKGVVAPTEFARCLALIVGGSRGLGELTAKIIAAGGGRVLLTWRSGKDDAERVAKEIRAAGGACETLAYDARRPAAEQIETLAEVVTHAYYFATPTIYRPQPEIFVTERLKEFLTVYVDGFWQLSQALRAREPRLSIFYPSTVFVAERPKGMTEYAIAKAAGEVLCAEMNASLAPMHVTASRLPRLPTDQTASLTSAATAHPLETLLPIIREVQSWPR
jgi:NAD(P)-dependent dehydrogenase (short-subunit alcohol dehydrogenase family)